MAMTAAGPSPVMLLMRIVSTLELVSLVVILTNRFTVHVPVVTSTGGPVHGLLYVSTILLALILPIPRKAKWFAVIPGVGGVLALWWARRVASHVEPTRDAEADGQVVHLTDVERAGAIVVADDAALTVSGAVRIGPLSFAVPRGSITGFVGPNGAGKTTALRAICGLIAPTSGNIVVTTSVDRSSTAARVGALIDSPGLLPSLTARENLLVLTRLRGWGVEVADRALERGEMAHAAHQRVGTFSLGMKQRLGLAAALLGEPDLVILDEPTNGLDPRGKIELRTFLRRLQTEGTTIILASHALDDIEELCDHLVAMDHGRVIFHGTPDQMLHTVTESILCRTYEPDELATASAAFEGAGYRVEAAVDGVRVHARAAEGGKLNNLAQQAGATLSEISPARATLESAFLALTSHSDASTRTLRHEDVGRVPA